MDRVQNIADENDFRHHLQSSNWAGLAAVFLVSVLAFVTPSVQASQPDFVAQLQQEPTVTITVQQGDTLSSIAQHYMQSIPSITERTQRIMLLNNMHNSTLIAAQTLRIPQE